MKRVCLFAQFDPRHRIRPHVIDYVAHLQRCGFHTVVAVSGSRLPPYDDREALRATGAEMVFRPNHGLDFGAWQHLVRDGHADGADAVLLANDSVFGPFSDLAPIFRRMDRYDAWGMIESRQHGWHLQSWFLHMTARAWAAPAVARIFRQDFARMTKDDIIENGELALGRALRAENLRCGAVVGQRHATFLARRRPLNHMHIDWRHNLRSGRMPFIKADLLRANGMSIPWAGQWDAVLRGMGVPTQPISDYLYAYTNTTPGRPGLPYPVPIRTPKLPTLALYALASRDHLPAVKALALAIRDSMFEKND